MLINIGRRTPARGPLDAVEMLVECHERIRTFTDLARRLADDRGAEPVLRAEAARSIHRYFASAFPLHVLDEDSSLMPRLWHVADERLQNSIVTMADQHADIEETVADLLPEWRDAAVGGHALPAFVRVETEALDLLLTVHLELEEDVLFPAARRLLPAEELANVANEIRARRAHPDLDVFAKSPFGANP